MKRLVLVALLAIAGCAGPDETPPANPSPVGAATGRWREQIHWISMTDAKGARHLLYTRVCRPEGEARARVVMISHGTPADASLPPSRRPTACDGEAAQWFLSKGFVVVAGMRRCHGPTGGELAETSSGCGVAEFVRSAKEAARDLDAIATYAMALPFAKPDGLIAIGQSTGGWSTIGYNTAPHARVAAMVNMAGGRGGHVGNVPNNNCRPDQLALAAGALGGQATTPMLWIYTRNDTYFGPDLAAAMHANFANAGGKAEFKALGPWGNDGHDMFFGRGGSETWGPLVAGYLRTRPGGLAP